MLNRDSVKPVNVGSVNSQLMAMTRNCRFIVGLRSLVGGMPHQPACKILMVVPVDGMPHQLQRARLSVPSPSTSRKPPWR